MRGSGHSGLRAPLGLGVLVLLAGGCGGCGGGGGGGGSPPTITAHPSDQMVAEGQAAAFSVTATGSGTLTYQWKKNGIDIDGATSSSYTTPPATLADDGAQFTCVVTNEAGSTTSDVGAIVMTPPSITTDPAAQTVTDGEAATFTVVAAGPGKLAYQWQKDTVDIAGATDSSYTTPATTLADDGAAFTCVVSNLAGSVTSSPATLTVNLVSPKITMHPSDQTVGGGEAATFTVTAAGAGGGMRNANCNGTVTVCSFNGNTSSWYGGGMCNSGGSLSVTDCSFVSNTASNMTAGRGGGMFNDGGSLAVTRCIFLDNEVTYGPGGGMFNLSASPTVTNCIFSGNSAALLEPEDLAAPWLYGGGGMHNEGSSPTITNCTFSGNQTVYGWGGGMHNWNFTDQTIASPDITNCTFSGNASALQGDAMRNFDYSSPTVTNCIFWGDTAPIGAEFHNVGASSSCTAAYSDVQGGYAGVGNINDDPVFADPSDPDGPDNVWMTFDDGLRLGPGSPCIDAADGDAAPATDILYRSRRDDPAPNTGAGTPPYVDMGAYEYWP